MSHYRTIEVEGRKFQYVVGNYRTKITEVVKAGMAFTGTEVGLYFNNDIGHVYDEDRIAVRPGHIEKVIRRELSIPQREYDWDKPMTKKSDPGPRTRGFRQLIGVRIVDIRVSAINEVILEGENGDRYAIETDSTGPLGLGVISLRTLTGTEAED